MPIQFTPFDANQTLPLVERIVADILETGRIYADRFGKVLEEDDYPALFESKRTLNVLMEELDLIGCEYGDWSFEKGWVEFPAVMDGNRILLCWEPADDMVRWFRFYEDGGRVRRPLPREYRESREESPAAG
ncbi:MAG: DUF2203 family protein [Gemmatimonadetes bacterium]|nr:DUF2203 family protein [Gemmatimonadota bacterium]